MTCWLTKESMETALGLVTEGCIVVSDHMLISILSVWVEALEICALRQWMHWLYIAANHRKIRSYKQDGPSRTPHKQFQTPVVLDAVE